MRDGTDASPRERRAIRRRLLDRIGSAPITVLSGLFWTGKRTLLNQWSTAHETSRPVVRVAFPRHALSESQCASLLLRQLVNVDELDDRLTGVVTGLQVGAVAVDDLLPVVPELVSASAGVTLVCTSYEWQSTDRLDRLLVTIAAHGVGVVCSLIDPDGLLREASFAGVTASVIDDADLALRPEELESVIRVCGVQPNRALVGRIIELTGGHATLSGSVVQHLRGATGITVLSGGRVGVTYASTNVSAGDGPDAGLGGRSPRGSGDARHSGLLRIDPQALTLDFVREVVGLLRYLKSDLDALAATQQGRSPFLRVCRVLSRMTSVDVDVVATTMPGLHLQHQTRRLVDAGYGRYVVGLGGHLEFVWLDGIRLMLVDNLSLVDDEVACGIFDSIATCYADDGRLRDFAESIRGCGDALALEHMAERYFLEVTWELLPAGFARPALALPPGASARQVPHLTILVVLSRLWSGGLGERDRSMVEIAVRELLRRVSRRSLDRFDAEGKPDSGFDATPVAEAKGSGSTPGRSVFSGGDGSGVIAALLCGVYLAGHWGMVPSLESLSIDYVRSSACEGRLCGKPESRLGAEIGSFALMRLRFMTAAAALRISQKGMHDRNPGVQSLVVECADLLRRINEETVTMQDDGGLVDAGYMDDLSLRVPPLATPIEALRAASSLWRLVDGGAVAQAADRGEAIASEHPDLMEYPLVGWSVMVAALLAGRFRRAAVVRGARRTVGADWAQPGMGLASFFDALTRLRGMWEIFPPAVEMATAAANADGPGTRSNLWYAVLELFFHSSKDDHDGDPAAEDATWDAVIGACRDESARLRVIAGTLAVARMLRVGRNESADSLCARVLAMGGPSDMAAALHIVSSSDAKRILRLPTMVDATEGIPGLAESISWRDGCPYVLPDIEPGRHDLLSDAQMGVLRLVAQGMSNAQVALQLHVSVNTVKSHLRHVFIQLGVTNRKDAGRRAQELGLL